MSEQVNVILAPMAGRTVCTTKTVYQYNSGMLLKLIGLELPTGYEVDFANSATGSSITQVGNADGVRIPDQFFVPGSTIHAWYVAVGTDYAVTRYHIMIPIAQRASRTNEEPIPSQESALDEAIAALNDAVEHSPKIEDGDWYTWDASAGAWVNTGVQAEGQDGFSPVVGIGKIGNRITLTITDAEGPHSVYLYDGTDGVGISSIEKTSTVGLVDTYTVTLTNGQTTTFTVTNGQNGTSGVSPEITVSEITGGHRITITDADHPSGQTVDVMDGENGDPGRGIVSVTKIGTSGLVDTYQITYTSGEPTTFTVTNGQDGADGVSPAVSVSAITGGHSVTITDKDHPSGQSFDVLDGTNGTDGQDGTDGTTFTPSVAANGDLSWSNDGGKTNPATVNIKGDPGPGVPAGGTDGQMLVKKSGTDYDTEWANQSVTDVQVNGSSIVSNGVANIEKATDAQVKAGSETGKMLVPSVQDAAAFFGLAKAAGDSSQSASSNAVGTYTADAKKKIRMMLGIPNTEWELINEVSVSEDSEYIEAVADSNGQAFKLIKMMVLYNAGASTTGTRDYMYCLLYNRYLNNSSELVSGTAGLSSIQYPSASSNIVAKFVLDANYPAPMTFTRNTSSAFSSTSLIESMPIDRISKYFTGFRIYQSGTGKSLVPAGAKLTIYGIRYDE